MRKYAINVNLNKLKQVHHVKHMSVQRSLDDILFLPSYGGNEVINGDQKYHQSWSHTLKSTDWSVTAVLYCPITRSRFFLFSYRKRNVRVTRRFYKIKKDTNGTVECKLHLNISFFFQIEQCKNYLTGNILHQTGQQACFGKTLIICASKPLQFCLWIFCRIGIFWVFP